VLIGRLQRYAVDEADRRGIAFLETRADSGRRTAVVGSGPAGLACAAELRAHGHRVTLFEARNVVGGLNTLGIAPYKISTSYALEEAQRILRMGVDFRPNTAVGGGDIVQLLASHDAVFLGVGLGRTADLGIPGEENPGVWEALDFIFQAHRGPFSDCRVGRKVVVLGGGNTAMDAACKARRLGAESVTVVYRRTAAEMPAYLHEYELAKADGAVFEWLSAPLAFRIEKDRLLGVTCRRVKLSGRGRNARVLPQAGTEFEIPCDMAVKALGQDPLRETLSAVPGLRMDHGRIAVDAVTCATGVPRLYAGGDCISGGAEVVHAVQQGKLAARAIHDSFQAPESGRSNGRFRELE
jgi:glutamate synthase (NADPH/NADH) small chain